METGGLWSILQLGHGFEGLTVSAEAAVILKTPQQIESPRNGIYRYVDIKGGYNTHTSGIPANWKIRSHELGNKIKGTKERRKKIDRKRIDTNVFAPGKRLLLSGNGR